MRAFHIFGALALVSTLALTACDDSIVDAAPTPAEQFATQIRQISQIDGVDVFVGADRRYLFADGPREDAIQLSNVTVEGTVLVVTTVSQGTYYFDLGKVASLNVSDSWVVLNF